jgi:hypothetical protein
MKTCPVCALELEDSYLFCPEDGSSLTAVDASSTAFIGTHSNEDPTNVVLYCPACGAEYPLTFSLCPVHGVPLTKQRIQIQTKQPAIDAPAVQVNTETIALNRPPFITLHKNTPTDNFDRGLGGNIATVSNSDANKEIIERRESDVEASTSSLPGSRIQPPSFSSEAPEADRTGFRIAAIATIIALAVFGLVGIYALVSNLSRRPSPATRPAGQTENAQEVPFVVTPQAASDFKDADTQEQSAASASEKATDPQATTRVVEPEPKETPSSSNGERNRTAPDARPIQRMPSQATRVSTPATEASDPPAPALPHTSSREFDSRLVRARSSRTSAGYRYDLTFNMQEQLGHSTQWQRVLITSRSASGASHTQAIPFVHRLGATGALTFTISVELTGRSEADWRGRINCTTLGWDNTGAPLQATFVANVTP